MNKLTGKIIKETDKAIRFYIKEEPLECLDVMKIWLPKSKIKLPKQRKGIINIYVQEWLYDNHYNQVMKAKSEKNKILKKKYNYVEK